MMMNKKWALLHSDGKTVVDVVSVDPKIPGVSVDVSNIDAIEPGWIKNEKGGFQKPKPMVFVPNKTQYVGSALTALQRSDVYIVRFYEAGKPVPKNLIEYRKKLREIVRNGPADPSLDTSKPLPELPQISGID